MYQPIVADDAAMSKKVVIIGGGLSGKHLCEQLVKQKDLQVTVIQANTFVEWTIPMAQVLAAKPHMYEKCVAPNPESYQVKDATYKFGPVTSVDVAGKTVAFKAVATGADESVPYDVLVVCTGFSCPLIAAKAGVSLEDRKAEVSAVAAAILKAKSVVVNGGGSIGVELASNIKTTYKDKDVVLVARDGVLKDFPEKTRGKITAVLDKMGIKTVIGTSSDAPPAAKLDTGSLTVNGEALKYDVYLPMFGQGPNTQFLTGIPGLLDDRGFVKVNEFLQSRDQPSIFTVGVGDNKESYIGIAKLEAQYNDVAANIKAYFAQKPMKPHKEGAPFMKNPPWLPIGVGKDAWLAFDFDQLPPPLKCCCCCGLCGFPFCPPPCCWCKCSPFCFGYCCCPPEGNGPASAMEPFAFEAVSFHFKGFGEAPKQQSMS
jgi:NADH dehydrogenase FAD-containing subunit